MKRLCAVLALLVLAAGAVSAQDGGLTKLDVVAQPRVYADSVSNLGLGDSTEVGPSVYIADLDYNKRLQVAAYRVGAATNGFNFLLDFSPDGDTWTTSTTVILDSVGTALTYGEATVDSTRARGSAYARARLKGLALINDTTDVYYWIKIP